MAPEQPDSPLPAGVLGATAPASCSEAGQPTGPLQCQGPAGSQSFRDGTSAAGHQELGSPVAPAGGDTAPRLHWTGRVCYRAPFLSTPGPLFGNLLGQWQTPLRSFLSQEDIPGLLPPLPAPHPPHVSTGPLLWPHPCSLWVWRDHLCKGNWRLVSTHTRVGVGIRGIPGGPHPDPTNQPFGWQGPWVICLRVCSFLSWAWSGRLGLRVTVAAGWGQASPWE